MTLAELQTYAEMALRNHALCDQSCRVRVGAREVIDGVAAITCMYAQLKCDLPVYTRHPGVPQRP